MLPSTDCSGKPLHHSTTLPTLLEHANHQLNCGDLTKRWVVIPLQIPFVARVHTAGLKPHDESYFVLSIFVLKFVLLRQVGVVILVRKWYSTRRRIVIVLTCALQYNGDY